MLGENHWLDRIGRVSTALFALCAVVAAINLLRFVKDDRYVHALALDIVETAHAEDARSKVIALRDYLRAHVDNVGLARDGSGRRFLRASAAETLRSGKGLCGEVSRAFIVMARSLGIRAQRLNLLGAEPHVVAEAEIAPHHYVVVDAQEPPAIKDLESLDQVILRPEFDDYSTLNLRRAHLYWLVPRLKLDVYPLTAWLERPSLIRATLWLLLAGLVILAKLVRLSIRAFLHDRGWVHVTDDSRLKKKGLYRGQAS